MPVKARGGGYQADLSTDRGRVRHLFETEAAAEGWLADAKAALANGRSLPEPKAWLKNPSAKGMLFKTACDRCYADEYAHVKSGWPRIVELYMATMQEFWPGATLAEVATPDEAARYTRHLHAQGLAQSTINSKLSVYTKVCTWGVAHNVTASTPKVKRKTPDNARLTFLSEEDEVTVLRLLRQFNLDDVHDAVQVLIDTGLRPSELFRLTGADLGEAHVMAGKAPMRITVRQSKNGTSRDVIATKRVRAVLERRVRAYDRDKLFPALNQGRLTRGWNRVREVMKREAEPEFIPYICRHTCASRMVQRGVPIGVIQKWMGHKTIAITMRYAKHAPGDFIAAALTLERTTA